MQSAPTLATITCHLARPDAAELFQEGLNVLRLGDAAAEADDGVGDAGVDQLGEAFLDARSKLDLAVFVELCREVGPDCKRCRVAAGVFEGLLELGYAFLNAIERNNPLDH